MPIASVSTQEGRGWREGMEGGKLERGGGEESEGGGVREGVKVEGGSTNQVTSCT